MVTLIDFDWWKWRTLACLAFASVAWAISGCGSSNLPVAPMEGKVLYNGQPLSFGSVMFQPSQGPPAHGQIQSDGTFRLSTYEENDGAVIGTHKVRVTCLQNQAPNAASSPEANAPPETMFDKSLIPTKYGRIGTSGITVEVKDNNEPFQIDLAGP